MTKPKLLFIEVLDSSFAKQDEQILAKHFRVRTFAFGHHNGLGHLARQVRLVLWLLLHLPGARATFIWFSDYHSFFPALLSRAIGVKSYIVIGGFDATALPELGYGAHRRPARSRLVRWNAALAHRLLHVSRLTRRELSRHVGSSFEHKYVLVPNGIDLSVFPDSSKSESREKSGVVCVSTADTLNRMKIKGLDRLSALAERTPDIAYTLVGATGAAKEWLSAARPPNLTLVNPMPREDLHAVLRRSQVICQLSRYESFGLAVAEGMLFECVPVVSANLGMDDLVDEAVGFRVDPADTEGVDRAVRQGLARAQMGAAARQRILSEFTVEQREARLLKVLEVEPG